MIKRILPFLILVVLAVALAVPGAAAAQTANPLATPTAAVAAGNGVITGKLVNASKDGGNVSGVTVTLGEFKGTTESSSVDATTDAQGQFQFAGLTTTSDMVYLVKVTYKTAVYHSDVVTFAAGETTKDLSVNVYNPTNVDPGVSVALNHTLIQIQNGKLVVQEILQLSNPSDLAYIGSQTLPDGTAYTLKYWLPADATNVQLGNGFVESNVAPTVGGFVDNMPVTPQGGVKAYTYTVASTNGQYTLNHLNYYPTASYDLLIQDTGVKVQAPQLSQPETVSYGNNNYLHMTGADLAANTTLTISILGTSAGGGGGSNLALWLGLGLGLAAVAILLAVMMMRQRRPSVAAVPAAGSEREELLDKMAKLDDEFEAGRIPAAEYKTARDAIKARLLEIRGNK